MSPTVTVTDAARGFSDLINRVVYRGESFVLERGGSAVARLVPLPRAGRLGDLPGILESVPRLTPEEAGSLGADLDDARRGLPDAEDPWAS